MLGVDRPSPALDPPNGRTSLAVIIPTFRGANRIGETLRSIASDAPGSEVVVVDDGSDDGTERAARGAGDGLNLSILVHPRNRGRAAARNTGLKGTTAERVIFLDDDMTVQSGFLAAHREAGRAAADSSGAFLGRIVLPPAVQDTPFDRFLRHEEEDRHRALLAARERVSWRFCLTGNLSARREILLGTGGFDEAITRYGFEDIDLGLKLHRAGRRLEYLPGAVAVHRAYAIDLARMRERSYLSGRVASYLARIYADSPEVRSFLRIGGMGALRPFDDSTFMTGMKTLNLLVRKPWMVRFLSGGPGRGLLDAWIAILEKLPARKLRHLFYHFARDVAYYRGMHDASFRDIERDEDLEWAPGKGR